MCVLQEALCTADFHCWVFVCFAGGTAGGAAAGLQLLGGSGGDGGSIGRDGKGAGRGQLLLLGAGGEGAGW